jgi:hypothetical protein
MLILEITSLYLWSQCHSVNAIASIPQHRNIDKTMIDSGQLRKFHKQVVGRILSSREGSREDKKKSDPNPPLKVEEKGYLLTQELPSHQTTRTLNNDRVGTSLISEVGKPVNYRLRLPADAKTHSGLHTSLFEPADLTSPLLTTFHFQTEEEDEFEVEEIVERRKGYPHSENTWEPIQNLGNCQMILRQFRRTAKSRRHRTAESSRFTP